MTRIINLIRSVVVLFGWKKANRSCHMESNAQANVIRIARRLGWKFVPCPEGLWISQCAHDAFIKRSKIMSLLTDDLYSTCRSGGLGCRPRRYCRRKQFYRRNLMWWQTIFVQKEIWVLFKCIKLRFSRKVTFIIDKTVWS